MIKCVHFINSKILVLYLEVLVFVKKKWTKIKCLVLVCMELVEMMLLWRLLSQNHGKHNLYDQSFYTGNLYFILIKAKYHFSWNLPFQFCFRTNSREPLWYSRSRRSFNCQYEHKYIPKEFKEKPFIVIISNSLLNSSCVKMVDISYPPNKDHL